jgi:hypothetical protein
MVGQEFKSSCFKQLAKRSDARAFAILSSPLALGTGCYTLRAIRSGHKWPQPYPRRKSLVLVNY